MEKKLNSEESDKNTEKTKMKLTILPRPKKFLRGSRNIYRAFQESSWALKNNNSKFS